MDDLPVREEVWQEEPAKKGAVGMSETVVRQRGEGDAYWVLGGLYEVRVSGAETDGEYTVMEMTVPAGMGPPTHTHPGSEMVRVLEGSLRLHVGERAVEVGEGGCFFLPGGTLETFEPLSDEVRLMVVYTPGGIDRFFAEVGEPAARREVPPRPTEPPDLQRITALGERYGMTFQVPAHH